MTHLEHFNFQIITRTLTVRMDVVGTSPIQFSLVLRCTFRASCYSTCLSWAHSPVINWAVCLGQKVSECEEGVVT